MCFQQQENRWDVWDKRVHTINLWLWLTGSKRQWHCAQHSRPSFVQSSFILRGSTLTFAVFKRKSRYFSSKVKSQYWPLEVHFVATAFPPHMLGVHFRSSLLVVPAYLEDQHDCMATWNEKHGCEVSRLLLTLSPALWRCWFCLVAAFVLGAWR